MVYTSWGSSDFLRSSTFSFLMSFSICVEREEERNGDQSPVYSIASPHSLAPLLLSLPLPSLCALPPARPLSPWSSSAAGCPLLWGSLSPSSTQGSAGAELGTWGTGRKGTGKWESRFRICEPVCLYSSSQTLSPLTPQLWTVADKPHLGIESGQLLDLLPHLFSFLHPEPAPEGAERVGIEFEREAKGAGGGPAKTLGGDTHFCFSALYCCVQSSNSF